MKVDLRLPLGLVNVALDAGSQLSSTLDHLEDQKLKEAISSGGIQGATSSSEKENSQQIEIIIEEDD
jgi:hypothetical protein